MNFEDFFRMLHNKVKLIYHKNKFSRVSFHILKLFLLFLKNGNNFIRNLRKLMKYT